MNIKELKSLIKDLPDDMLVVEAYDGDMTFGVFEIEMSIEDKYENSVRGKTASWISPFDEDWEFKEKVLCVKTYS